MKYINKYIEDGYSISKISYLLDINKNIIKDYKLKNNLIIKKEEFSNDKIQSILDLYIAGVSAKSLAYKFSIDKRRILKFIKDNYLLKEEPNKIFTCNHNIFDQVDNKDKAYWLGFLYADAYNSTKKYTLSLTLKRSDTDHIHKFADFIDIDQKQVKSISIKLKNKTYKAIKLSIYNKHLSNALSNIGCKQNKSFIISFPIFLNEELVSHFIRGIFDGDGSITYSYVKNYKQYKLVFAGTKDLLDNIQNIFYNKFNIKIKKLTNITKNKNNSWKFEVCGNLQVKIVMNYLYDDSNESNRLDRKYNRYIELNKKEEHFCSSS